ncbi:MAG TPA: efflux RND transporter periplasmic adaptor subunit [Thermodesulfobacteriota bacterium]|nr:efflux RND transporter periplasmic adaptor subunit [Thermodesulfobacteriota bacterium]
MKRVFTFTSLAAAAVIICACGSGYEKTITPVRVKTAAPGEISGPLGFTATVNPYSEVNLDFKVDGYVREIKQVEGANGRMRDVQEGDEVTKGMALASIDDTEYASKVIEAKSELGQAQASYVKGKADYDRTTTLYSTKSITINDYEHATKEYEVAKSQVEGAKAKVVGAQQNLDYCTLRSPMNGVIIERDVDVGSYVRPGTQGFVIADVTSVKVLFAVPDVILGDVKLGQEMAVSTESLKDRLFKGRVTAISPEAGSRSRVFNVEITIPNQDNALKPGMIASLALDTTGKETPVILLPLSSIVSSDKNSREFAVFVIGEKDGKSVAQKKDVILGSVYGNSVAVAEGLSAGEKVIVMGSQIVRDGEQVRIIP